METRPLGHRTQWTRSHWVRSAGALSIRMLMIRMLIVRTLMLSTLMLSALTIGTLMLSTLMFEPRTISMLMFSVLMFSVLTGWVRSTRPGPAVTVVSQKLRKIFANQTHPLGITNTAKNFCKLKNPLEAETGKQVFTIATSGVKLVALWKKQLAHP